MAEAEISRIAIYARVSGEKQVNGTSLDDQTDKCKQEAAQKGWTVVETFREEGVSGAKVYRAAIIRLIGLAATGQIDAVLLAKVDRLARGRVVDALLVSELEKHGVKVVYVGRDTSTKEGRLLVNIEKDFAEWEREVIAERMWGGKLRRALEGKVMNSPRRATYGYTYKKTKVRGGHYVVNPAEAKVVRQIYQWYVREGLALRAVAARLNEQRIPTSRGASHWGKTAVYSILSNTAYTGTWYWNKTQAIVPVGVTKNGKKTHINENRKTEKSSKRLLPESEWIAIPVPVIIDKAIYVEAQARLKFNQQNARRNTKRDYLLSGLVHCGACGRFRYHGMTYRGRKGKPDYSLYACSGRLKEHHDDPATEKCRNGGYMGAKLEALVWRGITDMLSQPEGLFRASPAESPEWRERAAGILAKLAPEQERLERMMERVMVAYKEGVIELGELQKERNAFKKDMEKLAKAREEIEGRMAAVEMKAVSQERVRLIARALKASLLRDTTFEEKRRLLERFKVKVTVQGEDVNVEGEIGSAALSYTSKLRPYVRRVSLYQADCEGKYPRHTRPWKPRVRGLCLHAFHQQVVQVRVTPHLHHTCIPKFLPKPRPELRSVAH